MFKISSVAVAFMISAISITAAAKPGHPSTAHSYLKCFKVGSLIQVGNQVQCSFPVVSKKETVRFCFDHTQVSYYPRNSSYKLSSYQLSLVKGGFHTLVRENFRSRLELDGENKTYIYSHAKKFSEFNEQEPTNLKVEFSKVMVDQKPTTLGKVTIQNQLYCF